MDATEYYILRERIRATCVKERHQEEYNKLMDRVEAECSPAQKAGITRIVRQKNSDADYYDMTHY